MNENFILTVYLFAEGTYITFYLIMVVLTTDQLATSLLLLKYQVIMTRTRIKIASVLCWVLGVISGALTLYKLYAVPVRICSTCEYMHYP